MIFKSSFLPKTLIVCAMIFASCSKSDEKNDAPMQVETIISYENIKFAVDQAGVDSKRFFSTSLGKSYSFNEINEEIGATIDLVWYDSSPTNPGFLFWEDPSNLFGDLVMPGATATKIENYQPTATVSLFDSIENDSALNSLTVEHSNDAMGSVEYPIAVLFENAAGKKGIIKMKSNDGNFLTVDIKVVK